MKGRITVSLLVVLTSVGLAGLEGQAFAQESSDTGGGLGSSKLIGAGMAFGLAALGAGIGLGFVGAAGLAAISDNPKMQSRVFIIVGMVESIAIYGIVMMFIILGQT
ncbi:MAG TPA: ATP synthase subunit C [Nitrososphaera sp.]|nr:ATP synthase subunit C [Nitrososphaera sp.]